MPLDREYLYRIYKKLGREALKESTIHGLHVFLYKTKLEYGRKLCFIFLLTLFIWTHYIIINLTIIYYQQPTEIHMSPKLVHVSNSPFPAMAICSASKFSKRKLQAFADQLFAIQQRMQQRNLIAKTSIELAKHLLVLAGFYVDSYDDYDINDKRLEYLHTLLTHFYGTEEYPSRDLLRQLAPDCESIVVRAQAFGKAVPPMELFNNRMTASSVCCLFNYIRPSYASNSTFLSQQKGFLANQRQVKFEANTMLNSITFVLQNDVEDFTYRELSNDAFRVHIFPPNEYAPMESKISEVFVNQNSIVDIPIQPKFFDSSDSIKNFPPADRKCYFPLEGQRLLNNSYYSLDECLLMCRMHSMLEYCGCVNPSLPADLISAPYCTLLDLPCLTQWKKLWPRWRERDLVSEEEGQIKIKSGISADYTRSCQSCLPACDGVTYDIFANEMPLRRTVGKNYTSGILKGLTNERPLAIVRLYFRQAFAQINVNVIVSDWVMLLNRFGGIMSFMYGFGLVSIIEFAYFASGKYFTYFTRSFRDRFKRNNETKMPGNYKLYWRELNPKALISQMNQIIFKKN